MWGGRLRSPGKLTTGAWMAAKTGPPPTLNQPVVGSSPTRLTPVERIRVALSDRSGPGISLF